MGSEIKRDRGGGGRLRMGPANADKESASDKKEGAIGNLKKRARNLRKEIA